MTCARVAPRAWQIFKKMLHLINHNQNAIGGALAAPATSKSVRRGAVSSISRGANGDGDGLPAEEAVELAAADLDRGLAPHATLVRRIFQYYTHFGQVSEWTVVDTQYDAIPTAPVADCALLVLAPF